MRVFQRVKYVFAFLVLISSSNLMANNFFGTLLNETSQFLKLTQHSAIGFVLVAFLAGILTSLLPCIYPMIPITLGILQGQGAITVRRNFQLAFAYVNGMAIVYAMLGYICARSAILFGSWLGNAWFVGAIVLFFLYMAGSMLGFYDLYIPRVLQEPKARVQGGSVPHCFVLGMLAASVASPCIAPPLAVLIGLVARQANPILGFAALYAFSLGMGMLLLLVGTFSGALSLLPRAGAWLDVTKQILGFVLLGVCVNFLQPLIGIKIALGLYASVVLGCLWFFSYRFYVLKSRQNNDRAARLSLVFATVMTIVLGVYFQSIFFGAIRIFLSY
jgi:thiol:disulfide interchange protein DsbD